MSTELRIRLQVRAVEQGVGQLYAELAEERHIEILDAHEARTFLQCFLIALMKTECVKNSVAMEIAGSKELTDGLERDFGSGKPERDASRGRAVIDYRLLEERLGLVLAEMEKNGWVRLADTEECRKYAAMSACGLLKATFASHGIPLEFRNAEGINALLEDISQVVAKERGLSDWPPSKN